MAITHTRDWYLERDSMARGSRIKRQNTPRSKKMNSVGKKKIIADADYVFVAYGVPGRATLGDCPVN